MRLLCILTIFILSSLPGLPGYAHASVTKTYRLGFPKTHGAPPYKWLIIGLEKKGFVVGDNLQLIPIDLSDYEDESGRMKIRQEIADKCDLFFSGGSSLEILFKIEPRTPLLFINMAGPERMIPAAMMANTTGVRIGSESGLFKQAIEMLPPDQRKKLGLISFTGSKIALMATGFKKTCAQLGFELVVKEYESKDKISTMMQEFKSEGISGLVLFPPAFRDGELQELIHWQNKLKLPIISLIKETIKKGLFGGPTFSSKTVMPNLADYAAKILQGRNPSQLPVKFYSPEYVVNLATTSRLGINVPPEVVAQADIVGLARYATEKETVNSPLLPGNFVVGISKSTAIASVSRFLQEFAKRGYVQDKNLRVQQYDLNVGDNPLKQRELTQQLNRQTDIIFANGSVLQAFSRLPDLKTPVCFVATKETAATIPANRKHHFTGVIRASFGSIIEAAQQIIPGTKRIVMIGRPGSKLAKTIKRHQHTARTYGVTLDHRIFTSKAEIGPLMRKLKENHDILLLYSPGVSNECITEIINWQSKLGFPVLAQFERHVRQGILAGMVVDMAKVAPKLAEYADKLIQGRTADQLPYYYYPGKMVINLRTASKLQLDIPADVTSQAEIIR